MSTQYPGGFITKSPVAPTTSAASGIWTVDQALQYVKAGTWPAPPNYIEDSFSTYLYTGTSATQTITNSIDLSTKGGLVWIKGRSGTTGHRLTDTARGVTKSLASETTAAQATEATGLTAFNTTGFTIGADADYNTSSDTYASWTFREQPKFFDVVTYTGNGTSQNIAHNLGSTPGCIIVKSSSNALEWYVWHRSLTSSTSSYIFLNRTDTATTSTAVWNNTAPTSTQFSVGATSATNGNGNTYVAYIFAHDAGGFGLTGTDNVISCGSFAGGTSVTVTLGYEPQWLLVKNTNTVQNWFLMDNMRGLDANQGDQALSPNTSGAEPTASSNFNITSTGFVNAGLGTGSDTFIYIAIRRGPMKVPTSGTSVFQPYNAADTTTQTVGFPTDMYFDNNKTGASYNTLTGSRLIGTTLTLSTSSTDAETTSWGPSGSFASNTTFAPSMIGAGTVWYSFRRAPSFFDEVCYKGTGSATTVTHNLAAVPELMIVRRRDGGGGQWMVYNAAGGNTNRLNLNATGAYNADISYWNNTSPTSSVFTVGSGADVNASGLLFVAYLFATCAGVSKVGSYTGTAALQTVACGFTSGARFVLIKRTDSTGDWYVWDSARGISSSTDPYLLLNSTAAEVTVTNYVDTDTTGFKVTAAASTTVNISAASYIFLAIA